MGDLSSAFLGENQQAAPIPAEELSEKSLVLESFTQFVAEKLEETDADVVSFPGGEIARKANPSDTPFVPAHSTRTEWEKSSAHLQALLKGKNQQLAVLFVTEEPMEPAVAEYFGKMALAMKLAPAEWVLTTLKDPQGNKSPQDVFEEAYWWRPRYVVTLGAQALQAWLGSRERLAHSHGKIFPLPRFPEGIELVPLFHPGVISSNQNMKRSTWEDMQKIMRLLGKA